MTQGTENVGTEATFKMERAIACLALELPAEVWEDVRDIWHAAKDSLAGEIENAHEDCAVLERRVQKLRDALFFVAHTASNLTNAQFHAKQVLHDD